VNITDAATSEPTRCVIKYGPCVLATDPEIPRPDASNPAACDDTSFSFYFTSWLNHNSWSLHFDHVVAGGNRTTSYTSAAGPTTHSGSSPLIDNSTYPDRWEFSCGGSAHCWSRFLSQADPVPIPFDS
jgi:hypothetical protein